MFEKEVLARLKNDFKFKKISSTWLQYGKCPKCNKNEFFCAGQKPYLVKCGRSNKCGYEITVKELYPEIFTNFNEKFIPTKKNPHATADAYMHHARGFDLSKLKKHYRQESFRCPKTGQSTATVRFYINREKNIFMERFVQEINVKQGDDIIKRRAHFGGAHRGLWWQAPDFEIKQNDEIWITEGILDAIALLQNGIKAVSILSSGNYPTELFAEHHNKNIKFIFALDNDKAGQKFTKKHIQRAEKNRLNVSAAQIPTSKDGKNGDWNDLHQAGRKFTKKHLQEYYFQGQILIEKTAMGKGLLIWSHNRCGNNFSFNHHKRTYWFGLDLEKLSKKEEQIESSGKYKDFSAVQLRNEAAKESGSIVEIANCEVNFLYYQKNDLTDESWYYCIINFPIAKPSIKGTFTGGQLSVASEFKKRLLNMASGAVYTGNNKNLNHIIKEKLPPLKTVETIDFIGYSAKHKSYIFGDYAFCNGKAYKLNEEDYFEIDKLFLKTLSKNIKLKLGDFEDYQTHWITAIWNAFGAKGMITFAFWFATLFAEQIRENQASFPFLETVGEAGAGKTTLIEFLWRLVGRIDYEGYDPSAASHPARMRNFVQTSNLPVVLMEGDRNGQINKYKQYDFNELKPLFNGRAPRSTGVKNGGNDTYEPPFRGGIIIAQNQPVNADEAILQRIIHVFFDRLNHNDASKIAADILEKIKVENISYFLKLAILSEKTTMKIINEKAPIYQKEIMAEKGVKTQRLGKNHGQIMAAADALAELTDWPQEWRREVKQELKKMACDRQKVIGADHPIVANFWDVFEYLQTIYCVSQNHSNDDKIIAINLNQFYACAAESRQEMPPMRDVQIHLKSSISHRFREIKTVSSSHSKKSLKCWTFDK